MPDSADENQTPKRKLVLRRPDPAETPEEPPLFRDEPAAEEQRRPLRLRRESTPPVPPPPAKLPELTPEEEDLLRDQPPSPPPLPPSDRPSEVDLFRMQLPEAPPPAAEDIDRQLAENPLKEQGLSELPPEPPLFANDGPAGNDPGAKRKIQLRGQKFDVANADGDDDEDLEAPVTAIFEKNDDLHSPTPKKQKKSRPKGKSTAKSPPPPGAKPKSSPLLPLLLVLLLIGAGAYWWLVMRQPPQLATSTPEPTTPRVETPRPQPVAETQGAAASPTENKAFTEAEVAETPYAQVAQLELLFARAQWVNTQPPTLSIDGILYRKGNYIADTGGWRIVEMDTTTQSIELQHPTEESLVIKP
ncbi:MAG: hypothetical protein Q7P63_11350 [Verrucomicrobiota bacterium JB022]|nr:hypothetical protein [Verrucomicrobiota bacterium JB022]